jgi:hypothetical protein
MLDSPEELERILERGIAGYSDAEPLAGMEERIVARIHAADRRRPGIWGWRAALILGLAVMAIAASGWLLAVRGSRQTITAALDHKAPPPYLAPAPILHDIRQPPSHRRGPVRVSRTKKPPPKGPIFPTPSPATREERLLLVLVEKNPEEAAKAFASLRQQEEGPIAIAPITIAPIATNDDQ